MSDKENIPAFPISGPPDDLDWRDKYRPESNGMMLRDYFAAAALTGILGSRHGFLVDVGVQNAPAWAYQVADGMLEERKAQAAVDA